METYLSDCLKSLVDQDLPYDDYEIICVNDGSKDSSLNILKEYEKKYSNITVIEQENKGVSHSRNIAVLNAHGKYIWFVDADDKIASNCLREITNNLKEDLLLLGYQIIPENDFEVHELSCKINKEENINPVTEIHPNYCWTYIVKKSIIVDNNINFPTISVYEDVIFNHFIGHFSKTACRISAPVYLYRYRENSATHLKTDDSYIKKYKGIKSAYFMFDTESTKENEYTEFELSRINQKKNQILEWAFIWLALCRDDHIFNRELKFAKNEGLYPFKFRFENLKFWKFGSIKGALLAFHRFLLPCEICLIITHKMSKYITKKRGNQN